MDPRRFRTLVVPLIVFLVACTRGDAAAPEPPSPPETPPTERPSPGSPAETPIVTGTATVDDTGQGGSATRTQVAGPGPQADLSGTWPGTWANTAPDTTAGSLELVWEQTGSTLSGTITIDGTACLSSGILSGTIDGNRVEFMVVQREVQISYRGEVSRDSVTGTFRTNCDEARGTWEATRIG